MALKSPHERLATAAQEEVMTETSNLPKRKRVRKEREEGNER